MLSNPLQSMNEVKDGRDFSFSVDGSDKWASRQSGI